MKLLAALLDLVAPYICICCSREGYILCADCRTALPTTQSSCYGCQAKADVGVICRVCIQRTRLVSVQVATRYSGIAKQLVWQLKSSGIQQAAVPMAEAMARLVDVSHVLVVPIPTATSRRRQRGYDQSVLLARRIARLKRLPYADCLARLGQAHQVGSTRAQRRVQLQQAFRVRRPLLITGRHIVLVDDVVTTGASIEAATATLYDAGAQSVQALAFAQAIKKAPKGP